MAVTLSGAVASCATTMLAPAPQRLAAWTTALRDSQPEEAFAAVYRNRAKHLVFIGAKHANDTRSPTFRLIGDAYAAFEVDTVIVEGVPTSRGPNPSGLISYASSAKLSDGFQEGGETVPAVLGAVAEGAELWGGEPGDLDIRARLQAAGFSPQDLLGFYALRSIPEWIRERKIEHAGDPRLPALMEQQLSASRRSLGLDATVLPGFTDWASWYEAINKKPIGRDFVTEEAGPLADGSFGSNRVGAAISRARAAHLHELLVDHLNAGKTVMVIFGRSHLMIHRPALEAILGRPCYTGPDLSSGTGRCT